VGLYKARACEDALEDLAAEIVAGDPEMVLWRRAVGACDALITEVG